MLTAQRDRDLEGHGHSLRTVAEQGWQDTWRSRYSNTKLSRSITQLAVSFDRLLSDEKRCTAYRVAIDAAISAGARTFAVLGAGSLLPALHAARAGAHVAIVEPCEPLAELAREGARQNGASIVVVSQLETLRGAWKGAPDALVSERVDESLLAEGLVPQLHAAVRAIGSCPRHVLPQSATVTAVAAQLGFEGVRGFGLDGLDVDLRHFDALRPRGRRARQPPGFWPVRLVPARQPHRRLSVPFVAARIDFGAMCAEAAGGADAPRSPEPRMLDVEVTGDGWLNAVVFWFALAVGRGPEGTVSSAPPEAGSRHGAAGSWSEGWRQAACYLEAPTYVRRGDCVALQIDADTVHGMRFAVGVVARAPGGLSSDASPSAPSDWWQANLVEQPRLNALASMPINAYHLCMVADEVRNSAYRGAIERAVGRRAGCRVLDIGAGMGLLGLVASRAGASRVECVEMNETLARTATATLSASGVRDAQVWHCISTELPIDPKGERGPRCRSDVIVSEILDSGLVGEGVLHTMRDATRRLLAPGGCLVPCGARVYAMAVDLHSPDVGDLTFRFLERLRSQCIYSAARLHAMGHVKLTAAAQAFHFDFYAPGPTDGDGRPVDREVRLRLPVLRKGRCNAIAWWFDLMLDEQTVLPAGPGAPVRTWKQNLSHLLKPITVKKGDVVEALLWTSGDDQIHVLGGRPGEVVRPANDRGLSDSDTIRLEPMFA